MKTDEEIIEEMTKKHFSVQEVFKLGKEEEINVCINNHIVSLKQLNDFNKELQEYGFSIDRYGCYWRGSSNTYNTITIKKKQKKAGRKFPMCDGQLIVD